MEGWSLSGRSVRGAAICSGICPKTKQFFSKQALSARVSRLEQLLRENGIRRSGSASLARQLRERTGQTVTLVQEDGSGLRCRILDVDGEWVLVQTGKQEETGQEMLLRPACVESVRV